MIVRIGLARPQSPQPRISCQDSAGGAQLVFDRTQRIEGNSGREFFEIRLQQLFDSTVSRQTVAVKTQLTGADAAVGSMLYAVAFLGTCANALDVLHEHGYDVAIIGGAPSDTCQARFPATTCTALANQLSQSIAASLPIGDAAERDAFLLGVQALGFAPCQFIP